MRRPVAADHPGVEIHVEPGDPSVKRHWRRWTVLGALPAIIVGWYHSGFAGIALGLGVGCVVTLLAVAGPTVNLRLYGTPRPTRALLHVCATLDRRSGGTLNVEPDAIRWIPWRRYEKTTPAITISADKLESVTLYARRGIPRTCRIELRRRNGTPRNLTVFAPTTVVETALRTWTGAP
jgi:hypothetical protein